MAASENIALKDELDALRETAAKAAALEATVASYKKRMEEHVDLRRQVKLLERANTEHVQRAIEHEQAAAKANAIRAQLDIYKKQVSGVPPRLYLLCYVLWPSLFYCEKKMGLYIAPSLFRSGTIMTLTIHIQNETK